MNVQKHVTVLAGLMIAYGCLGVVAILIVLGVFGVSASFIPEPEFAFLTAGFGLGIAGLIAITEIPAIIAGWGLLKGKSWARVLALVVACVNLIEIPLGTALGVYALWVLLKEDTVRYLNGVQTHQTA